MPVLNSFSFKEVLNSDRLGGPTTTRTLFEGRAAFTKRIQQFYHPLLNSSLLYALILTFG